MENTREVLYKRISRLYSGLSSRQGLPKYIRESATDALEDLQRNYNGLEIVSCGLTLSDSVATLEKNQTVAIDEHEEIANTLCEHRRTFRNLQKKYENVLTGQLDINKANEAIHGLRALDNFAASFDLIWPNYPIKVINERVNRFLDRHKRTFSSIQ